MTVLRSILAVVAGFAVMAGIVMAITPVAARAFHAEDFRTLNQGFMLLNLAYSSAAAVIAGFVTAWIAGRNEVRHASVLGLLMIAASFISMRQQAEAVPGWYEVVIGGCGPVAAMVGAAVRMLTKRRPVPG